MATFIAVALLQDMRRLLFVFVRPVSLRFRRYLTLTLAQLLRLMEKP